jgi:hypothetical protein
LADNTKKNKTRIFTNVQKNIDYIKKCFCDCFDLIIREISLFNYRDKTAVVVYIEDLVEKNL